MTKIVKAMEGASCDWWYYGSCYYLPTPPLGQDMTQGQFLSGV